MHPTAGAVHTHLDLSSVNMQISMSPAGGTVHANLNHLNSTYLQVSMSPVGGAMQTSLDHLYYLVQL